MNLFALQDGDRIELADLDAWCLFCTQRNCSFEFFDDSKEHIRKTLGWTDVTWVSPETDGETVHIRLCLDRRLATLDRARQIRVGLYQLLGIPESTRFKHTLIDSARCIDLIDDRYCTTSGHSDPLPPDQSLFDFFGKDDNQGEP